MDKKNYFALPGMLRTVGFDESNYRIEKIVLKCCEIMGVSKEFVIQDTSKRDVVSKRQIIIYCLCKKTEYTLSRIGKYFNGLDHATVLHSKNKTQMFIDVGDDQGILATKIINLL